MAKVVIKCEDCKKKKTVTRRHRKIIGNQCVECLKEEMHRECMSNLFDDIYNY